MKRSLRSQYIPSIVATTLLTSMCGFGAAIAADSLEAAIVNGKAVLDLRYRYETVDQDGIDETASASTLRTRLN